MNRFLAGVAVCAMMFGSAANAAPIDFSTMQTNGVATATPTALRLTNGSNLADVNDPNSNIGLSSSAFIGSAFSTAMTFTSSFTFSLTNSGFTPQGDGITFLIQNDPSGAFAVGGGGGGVGANGLLANIGVGFQSWDNNRASIFTDGDITGGPIHNFNLGDQDNIVDVVIAYNGYNLSYTALNHSTGVAINGSKAFNLASLGPTVYIGFTGATGLSYSIQDVTNWDLTIGPAAVPEPGTWALMILGFGTAGAMLRRRREAMAVTAG